MSYLFAVADYWKLRAASALKSAANDQDGQGLVEYALILVLVAVIVIAILSVVGPQIFGILIRIACSMEIGQDCGPYPG